MAWIQQRIPPPNRIMDFNLDNFNGGLNNNSELLLPSQATNVLNMAFSDNTLMEKRKGTEEFDTMELSGPVVFIDEYKPYNDEPKIVRASTSRVYVGGTEIKAVAGKINGVNYNGHYYFTDGEALYVYGKFPQTESEYTKIVGTAVDEYRVMRLVNPPEAYVPLDETHVQGVKRYDYDANRLWYEPCENEMQDAYKGANVLPERFKYIVIHHGRLFVSGAEEDDDNVFISDLQNPLYFPVYLPIQLPPNSDKIKGLIVFDNAVVIGRTQDVYAIHGATNRPDAGVDMFYLHKVNTHTGFMNQETVDAAHNFLFYLGTDGNAYALSSINQSEHLLSTQMMNEQVNFKAKPIEVTHDQLENAVSIFHNDLWYLSVGSKVLIQSYVQRAWTVYDGYNATAFYKKGAELLFGNQGGRIGKESDRYMDFGKPYLATWESKRFDMEEPVLDKFFRDFFSIIHVYPDAPSLVRFGFEVDYRDVDEEIEVESNISRWGEAAFGSLFISRDILKSAPFLLGLRGRYIKFKFSNSWSIQASIFSRDEIGTVGKLRDGKTLIYVEEENKYLLYKDRVWVEKTIEDLDQCMKVYQVSGQYELRGKR